VNRALLAILVTLSASACRRVEETRFLNFDAESTAAGVLSSGWSGFEKTPEGDTFAWSHGRTAKVRLTSRADGDRNLRFRCWPFRYPDAGPQTVTVFVNDARIDTITLGEGPHVYALTTPNAVWKKGANDVTLQFAYAEAPKDRIPGGTDPRTLSAAFDWLEILPAPGPSRK
jgi:hypothetical protein